jgi:NADPH-dependent ferric siderophore reductase
MVFIGDDAALPAIARFLKERPAGSRAIALIELEQQNADYPLHGEMIKLLRPSVVVPASDALLDKVRGLALDPAEDICLLRKICG